MSRAGTSSDFGLVCLLDMWLAVPATRPWTGELGRENVRTGNLVEVRIPGPHCGLPTAGDSDAPWSLGATALGALEDRLLLQFSKRAACSVGERSTASLGRSLGDWPVAQV